MKSILKVLKYTFFFTIAFATFLFSSLIYFTYLDFKPEKETIILKSNYSKLPTDKSYKLFSWNIGYGGLDKNTDFFFDGGKTVHPTLESNLNNIFEIFSTINTYSNYDFILIQEIDINSHRSHFINQKNLITKTLLNNNYDFALNYSCKFIPFPIKQPYGKVESGLLNIRNHSPFSTSINSLPGKKTWPQSLFLPKRCALIDRYLLDNNKELIIMNIHLSAFDKGNVRNEQLRYLAEYALNEYNKGNYIVIAGDWNQIPPIAPAIYHQKTEYYTPIVLNTSLFNSNWQVICDTLSPTNRFLNAPYGPNSLTTIIDFALISPNVLPIVINNINLNFKNSDHNPFIFEFKLII